MAEYREIQGAAVQSLASSTGTIDGQIWYDNVNNVFKLQGYNSTAAWSSGTSLPAARFNMASGGTATAGIIAGGELSGGVRTGSTDYFDGTSWTNQPATLSPAPDADGVKMAGTQTAAILASFRGGGTPTDPAYKDAQEYNGTAWTTITSLSNRHTTANFFRSGSPTAATIMGGDNEIGGTSSDVEEWSGSAWASETSLPTTTGNMGAVGTPTVGLMFGGNTSSSPSAGTTTNTSFSYDGSTWTAGGNLSEARRNLEAAGVLTSAVAFGGYNSSPAATSTTDVYDGTSFSASASMSAARGGLGSTGSATSAYAIGGNPPVVATVEEWTGVGPMTKTITTT